MKLWPNDAETTGEKIKYAAVYIFVAALVLFMHLSAFGVFNNFYADACKGEGGWKIVGLLLSATSGFLFYRESARGDARVVRIIAAVIALALAFGAYAGFTYPYRF